ncbi:DUF1360 domain-containing protein [Candidatus Kaiserbacteria bacterium]|nr:DUF1360 domain-containing protein [Candidatus Kaiserbacteria bacterium]
MKFHFWHTTLSVFFIVLALLAYLLLAALGRLAAWIPFTDLFLIPLAIMRLVRLFAYDSITAFIREWFHGAESHTFAGSCGTLISCPWCLGLWFSLVVVFFYFLTPIAWYAILVLALSSLASFFQLVVNYVGWSAESKRREAEGIPLPR